jgi:hypothetical protein
VFSGPVPNLETIEGALIPDAILGVEVEVFFIVDTPMATVRRTFVLHPKRKDSGATL